MSGSPALAEDVTQEVFMVLLRDSTTYDSTRGPLNWFLLGIARNLVRQRLGREHFYAALAEEPSDDGSVTHQPRSVSDPLTELARNEIMEANERASALAHIDECEGCGQALSSQRELSDGLRLVAEQMHSLQAPAHLEEKLRAAFRAQALARPTRSAPRRWRY